MSLAQRIRDLKGDIAEIKKATSYTEQYVRTGSSCDSSSRSGDRIRYVLAAEKAFVSQHQKEILALAVSNMEAEFEKARLAIG